MFEIFRDKDTIKGGACGACGCCCNCGCGCGSSCIDFVAKTTGSAEVYDSDHEDFDYDFFFQVGRLDLTR